MRVNRRRHGALLLLLLLLLADLAYSFFQHYHATLDGDMADIILPAARYAQVLRDPLGLHALLDGAYYAAPNRFMPHWSMERWYKTAPHALQRIATPLDSVYLAGAVIKTIMQAALLYGMSAYASGTARPLNQRFLLAAVLLTPLFQTFGHYAQIGLVDGSPTYSFFYALASVWLMAFFLPHFFFYAHGVSFRSTRLALVALLPLAWMAAFNGPLNPAVLLIICPVVLLHEGWRRWLQKSVPAPGSESSVPRTPRWILWACTAGLLCAAWSYAVGRYNIESLEQTLPLRERYARLPKGIRDLVFDGPAPLLLANAMLLNVALPNIAGWRVAQQINRLALCFLLFAVVYTLLLPLGGYRDYRPYIIRRDSIQPVLIGAMIVYAFTALKILRHASKEGRVLYGLIPAALSVYFTYVDEPNRGNNYCEREALKAAAAAPGNVAEVDAACNIMAWRPIADPQQSANNARLLHYWGIFPDAKLYYQR